jgi:hypothetical protein
VPCCEGITQQKAGQHKKNEKKTLLTSSFFSEILPKFELKTKRNNQLQDSVFLENKLPQKKFF